MIIEFLFYGFISFVVGICIGLFWVKIYSWIVNKKLKNNALKVYRGEMKNQMDLDGRIIDVNTFKIKDENNEMKTIKFGDNSNIPRNYNQPKPYPQPQQPIYPQPEPQQYPQNPYYPPYQPPYPPQHNFQQYPQPQQQSPTYQPEQPKEQRKNNYRKIEENFIEEVSEEFENEKSKEDNLNGKAKRGRPRRV